MSGQHQHHHGSHNHNHHHAPGGTDWGELGAHLELEAEILSPYLAQAVWVLQRRAAAGPAAVRRILDVGCGPGVATTALALAFPDANVVALDRAPALLDQVRQRANRLGVGGRVSTMPADLEAGLGVTEPLDIAWAAMVLHHLPDATGLLRQLHGALQPGGLMAVVEFGPPTRVLPEQLGFGAPGFARRYAEMQAAALEAHLPAGALHANWPNALANAGFELLEQRVITVDLPAPLGEPARRWIAQGLQRSAAMEDQTLSADDRATLAILADPADPRGVMQRTDVEVHAGRSLFVARKAGNAPRTPPNPS